MEIIRSTLFSQFPSLLFGMSRRQATGDAPFDFNQSFNVGDDAENVKANRRKFFDALGIREDQVSFPMQEHTNNVQISTVPQRYPHCDALVTNNKDVFLAISVADCTPVMLFDPRKNVVAAVHAGWRGTSKRIVHHALTIMKEQFHVRMENLFAFLGPSAGNCCYEVGKEVAKLFPDECKQEKGDGKYFLDVKRANVLQLLANGVRESHIEVHPDCTIHNTVYHSFRRNGTTSGRMLSVIGMK
jgi:YfiH family protein